MPQRWGGLQHVACGSAHSSPVSWATTGDSGPTPRVAAPHPQPAPREHLVLGANPGRAGAGAQQVCGEPRSQVRGGSQGNSAVGSGSSGL